MTTSKGAAHIHKNKQKAPTECHKIISRKESNPFVGLRRGFQAFPRFFVCRSAATLCAFLQVPQTACSFIVRDNGANNF